MRMTSEFEVSMEGLLIQVKSRFYNLKNKNVLKPIPGRNISLY